MEHCRGNHRQTDCWNQETGGKSRRDAPAARRHDKAGTREGTAAVGVGLLEHSEGAKAAPPRRPANPTDHLTVGTAQPAWGCTSLSYEGIARPKTSAVTDIAADALLLQLLVGINPHHLRTAAEAKPHICVTPSSFLVLYFQMKCSRNLTNRVS